MVGEPGGLQVEGWTDVEDVRVGALPQVRDAQLGPGGDQQVIARKVLKISQR